MLDKNQTGSGMKTVRQALYYGAPIVALFIPLVSNEYLQFITNSILVYVLVTMGFGIVVGSLGQLAFANTAFFGLGAYASAIVVAYSGLPYPVGIACAAVVGGLAGFVASVAALRGIRLYYLAIVTLAFGELMRWLYLHGESVTKGSDGLQLPPLTFFGFHLSDDTAKFYVFLLITVLLVKATSNLMRSRFGRAIVAIRENEAATASLGIPTARYIVLAFVWSGGVVGIAGSMFAALTERVYPESFGLPEVITHYAMVLVGGAGSIVGSVIGAITLTVLPEFFRQFPGMEELFFGSVIVVVLLFLPKGLASLLARLSPVFNQRYYRD